MYDIQILERKLEDIDFEQIFKPEYSLSNLENIRNEIIKKCLDSIRDSKFLIFLENCDKPNYYFDEGYN